MIDVIGAEDFAVSPFGLQSQSGDLTLSGAGTDTFTAVLVTSDSTGSTVTTSLPVTVGAFTSEDCLYGGDGNDTCVVRDAGDTLQDSGGIDLVESRLATFTLGAGFENLTLAEAVGVLDGTGNAAANRIVGNSLANRIDGGGGADVMEGGLGSDIYYVGFRYNARDEGGDTITDFVAGTDRLEFKSAAFGNLAVGLLQSGAFVQGAAARPAGACFVYDQASGVLSFDANGSAAGGVTTIATLTGAPGLGASDIRIIA